MDLPGVESWITYLKRVGWLQKDMQTTTCPSSQVFPAAICIPQEDVNKFTNLFLFKSKHSSSSLFSFTKNLERTRLARMTLLEAWWGHDETATKSLGG